LWRSGGNSHCPKLYFGMGGCITSNRIVLVKTCIVKGAEEEESKTNTIKKVLERSVSKLLRERSQALISFLSGWHDTLGRNSLMKKRGIPHRIAPFIGLKVLQLEKVQFHKTNTGWIVSFRDISNVLPKVPSVYEPVPMTSVRNKLYSLGMSQSQEFECVTPVYEYSPRREDWGIVRTITTWRSHPEIAGITIGDEDIICLFGGFKDNAYADTYELLALNTKRVGKLPQTKTSLSQPLFITATPYDDQLTYVSFLAAATITTVYACRILVDNKTLEPKTTAWDITSITVGGTQQTTKYHFYDMFGGMNSNTVDIVFFPKGVSTTKVIQNEVSTYERDDTIPRCRVVHWNMDSWNRTDDFADDKKLKRSLSAYM
jgi:hypothetical protein